MEWDSTEVLEFNSEEYLDEVQRELRIYGMSSYADSEQIRQLFRDAVKVTMVEVDEKRDTTKGALYIQRGKKGTYWSIKNVRFHMLSFLGEVLSLAQSIHNITLKGEFAILVIFLFKMIQQFEIVIAEDEVTVCIALYQASQRYIITDENVIQQINCRLEECDYEKLNEKRIYKYLSNLVELGIIDIQDGKYQMVETLIMI